MAKFKPPKGSEFRLPPGFSVKPRLGESKEDVDKRIEAAQLPDNYYMPGYDRPITESHPELLRSSDVQSQDNSSISTASEADSQSLTINPPSGRPRRIGPAPPPPPRRSANTDLETTSQSEDSTTSPPSRKPRREGPPPPPPPRRADQPAPANNFTWLKFLEDAELNRPAGAAGIGGEGGVQLFFNLFDQNSLNKLDQNKANIYNKANPLKATSTDMAKTKSFVGNLKSSPGIVKDANNNIQYAPGNQPPKTLLSQNSDGKYDVNINELKDLAKGQDSATVTIPVLDRPGGTNIVGYQFINFDSNGKLTGVVPLDLEPGVGHSQLSDKSREELRNMLLGGQGQQQQQQQQPGQNVAAPAVGVGPQQPDQSLGKPPRRPAKPPLPRPPVEPDFKPPINPAYENHKLHDQPYDHLPGSKSPEDKPPYNKLDRQNEYHTIIPPSAHYEMADSQHKDGPTYDFATSGAHQDPNKQPIYELASSGGDQGPDGEPIYDLASDNPEYKTASLSNSTYDRASSTRQIPEEVVYESLDQFPTTSSKTTTMQSTAPNDMPKYTEVSREKTPDPNFYAIGPNVPNDGIYSSTGSEYSQANSTNHYERASPGKTNDPIYHLATATNNQTADNPTYGIHVPGVDPETPGTQPGSEHYYDITPDSKASTLSSASSLRVGAVDQYGYQVPAEPEMDDDGYQIPKYNPGFNPYSKEDQSHRDNKMYVSAEPEYEKIPGEYYDITPPDSKASTLKSSTYDSILPPGSQYNTMSSTNSLEVGALDRQYEAPAITNPDLVAQRRRDYEEEEKSKKQADWARLERGKSRTGPNAPDTAQPEFLEVNLKPINNGYLDVGPKEEAPDFLKVRLRPVTEQNGIYDKPVFAADAELYTPPPVYERPVTQEEQQRKAAQATQNAPTPPPRNGPIPDDHTYAEAVTLREVEPLERKQSEHVKIPPVKLRRVPTRERGDTKENQDLSNNPIKNLRGNLKSPESAGTSYVDADTFKEDSTKSRSALKSFRQETKKSFVPGEQHPEGGMGGQAQKEKREVA